MTKWIEEENGEVWIPEATAAKMLSLQRVSMCGLHYQGCRLRTRRFIVSQYAHKKNHYLLSEVETMARDPLRVGRLIASETQQEARKLGDPAKVDATFMTGSQVRAFLEITSNHLTG